MPEEAIGTVDDFFAHPVVAGIGLTAPLKVGDKILGINGVPIKNEEQLSNTISSKKIGSTIKILISRDEAKYEIPVSIGYQHIVFRKKQILKHI